MSYFIQAYNLFLIQMLSLELIKMLRGLYFGYSVYIIDSGLLWKQVMVHIIDILSPINILIPSRNILKCLFVTINTYKYTLAKVNLKVYINSYSALTFNVLINIHRYANWL